ncbi:DUF489 family protein [Ostreibacterium oceani]|uniref:DUF489 family protein n=1 Tax=Ostreibacterium oceani TaxID=2654998 RepID=A0A6N7F2T9_9GAMM|nr:DUF489 family protein [Ostreibacterium oceani]MPV86176.1 DUF489 family protein [Ostreibacterium oceani]
MTNEEQQVIGLAGAMQAICMVNDIASTGAFGESEALPILTSMATYNPTDALTAYGGDVRLLRHGLLSLQRLFNQNINRDIAQYIMMILTIELKLVRSDFMREKLQNGMQSIASDWRAKIAENEEKNETNQNEKDEGEDAFDTLLEEKEANPLYVHASMLEQPQFITQFADLYKETASKTEPRIMVKGHHEHLQNDNNANYIRALLLGSLRGASFFRHYGGKRLDFMLRRKQYLDIIQAFKNG